MGCCFSAKRHTHPQNGGTTRHQDLHRKQPTLESARATVDDRAPPPSLEQEYVKEVLSETPLPKLHQESATVGDDGRDQTQKAPVVSEEKVEAKERFGKVEEVVEEVPRDQVSEMCSLSEVSHSQVSEMCSVSESFSTATTFTEKRDDEVVSKPSGDVAQRVSRNPAKVPRKRAYSGERVPKSPARRGDPSPEKRGQAAARSARGAAQSRTRQPNAGYSGARRDPGEGSGRRSRSPVTRGTGGAGRGGAGRSPMKQTGRAGGKSQNSGAVQSQSQAQSKKEEPQNDAVQQQHGNESLENPHVSLECFIFL